MSVEESSHVRRDRDPSRPNFAEYINRVALPGASRSPCCRGRKPLAELRPLPTGNSVLRAARTCFARCRELTGAEADDLAAGP